MEKNVDGTIKNWKDKAEEKFSTWKTNVVKTVSDWKKDAEEKFGEFRTNIAGAQGTLEKWRSEAEGKFADFKRNTEETISAWYGKISGFFDAGNWNFSGIKEGLSSAFDAAISAVKGLWNSFAKWLNKKLTINIDTSSTIGAGIAEILGTSTITLGKLPTFANGGFPEDGLFMANRGELVGKFSNDKTAVANNEQIVAGIEYGVERAVERVLAPYLSQIAQNTRETADKDMSVNIGDREIARANARGKRSMGYTLITEV